MKRIQQLACLLVVLSVSAIHSEADPPSAEHPALMKMSHRLFK